MLCHVVGCREWHHTSVVFGRTQYCALPGCREWHHTSVVFGRRNTVLCHVVGCREWHTVLCLAGQYCALPCGRV